MTPTETQARALVRAAASLRAEFPDGSIVVAYVEPGAVDRFGAVALCDNPLAVAAPVCDLLVNLHNDVTAQRRRLSDGRAVPRGGMVQ